MSETTAFRTLLRGHRRSGRTLAASVLALVVAVVLVAVVVAAVWSAVDPSVGPVLREHLHDAYSAVRTSSWFVVGGVAAVAVGLWLVVLAVSPGRRHRRSRMTDRTAFVVDDTVLADAIAEKVSQACVLDRRQVSSLVGPRSARVCVTPTSGVVVDRERAAQAASDLVRELGFELRVRVDVRASGVIA